MKPEGNKKDGPPCVLRFDRNSKIMFHISTMPSMQHGGCDIMHWGCLSSNWKWGLRQGEGTKPFGWC